MNPELKNTIYIRRSQTYVLQGLLLVPMLLVFSCLMVFIRAIFPAVVMFIMSLGLAIALLLILRDHRPQIIFHDEHIELLGIGRIAFRNIKSVHRRSGIRGLKILIFTFHDSSIEPVEIQIQHLKIKPDELEKMINERILTQAHK